jgi:bilirubin oxidase
MRYSSVLLALGAILSQCRAKDWDSPVYNHFFEFPMPIPPNKEVKFTFTSPATGLPIDYYEVEIKPLTRQQYPELQPTRMVGYDGIVPGPTFQMTQGREAVVRFINHGDRANSVHLHGSFSRSPFDGYADDITEKGQYKDYYYPNRQNARTLWYHDHAVDHTAENVYFGQAGYYILHDQEELSSGLPTGQYDVPISIFARRYNANGSLWDPELNNEVTSVFGDVIEVNGQPWPFFRVEPRKYRFRFLGMGISRSYKLYMTNQATNKAVPFTIVGSDTGQTLSPVVTNNLTMSIAERWEAVIDFTGMNNQNVTIFNERQVGADVDFFGTDRILRFVVGNTVTSTQNNGAIRNPLRTVPFPPNKAITTRHFKFERQGGEWKINGIGWHDIGQRILAAPKRGSIEIWELENGGGGWTHPIHIHLVDFQVISRVNGKRGVLPYEKVALKDVVWLDAGETVRVIARYAPWPGMYMFHCHNLIHEDHEMLAEFNVTQVQGLNLNETNLFIDPLDPRFRAKSFPVDDFQARNGDFSQAAIQQKINFFAGLDAYADVEHVEQVLEAFWDNAGIGSPVAKRDVLNAVNGYWGKAAHNAD